jgi:hypothetical protein
LKNLFAEIGHNKLSVRHLSNKAAKAGARMSDNDDEMRLSLKQLVWLQEETNRKLAIIEAALKMICTFYWVALIAAAFWGLKHLDLTRFIGTSN